MPGIVEKMSENVDLLPSELVPDQSVVLLRAGYRLKLVQWFAKNSLRPYWVMWYNPDPGCGCVSRGKRYELTADRILLIPPHTLYSGEHGGAPRHYFIWFKTSAPFLTTKREVVELPAAPFVEKLTAAFQPGNLRRIRLYALVKELLLNVPDGFFDNTVLSASAKVVNQALKFINRRNGMTDNGEISAELHLSKTRLSHLFKSEMGISPQKYCIQVRMYRALQLLREGSDIKTVAEACGFADRYHFSKEFKKHHGMPPGKWLKTQSSQ